MVSYDITISSCRGDGMPPLEWTVRVQGAERQIAVDVDPQSGKPAVRGDGRIAAKPLPPDDQERGCLGGPFTYRLPRGPDGFSLEQVERQRPETTAKKIEAPRSPKPSYLQPGLSILRLLVVAGRGPSVYDFFKYWRVPWTYRYIPHENGFRRSFPDKPDEDKSTVRFDDGEVV